MAVDKDLLLKARLVEEEIDIPGVGTVRVRALTRAEAMTVHGVELSVLEMERKLTAMAMVDPVLTEDEVSQWQTSSPAGELGPVAEAIVRLSGMAEGADKATVRKFRGKK